MYWEFVYKRVVFDELKKVKEQMVVRMNVCIFEETRARGTWKFGRVMWRPASLPECRKNFSSFSPNIVLFAPHCMLSYESVMCASSRRGSPLPAPKCKVTTRPKTRENLVENRGALVPKTLTALWSSTTARPDKSPFILPVASGVLCTVHLGAGFKRGLYLIST